MVRFIISNTLINSAVCRMLDTRFRQMRQIFLLTIIVVSVFIAWSQVSAQRIVSHLKLKKTLDTRQTEMAVLEA